MKEDEKIDDKTPKTQSEDKAKSFAEIVVSWLKNNKKENIISCVSFAISIWLYSFYFTGFKKELIGEFLFTCEVFLTAFAIARFLIFIDITDIILRFPFITDAMFAFGARQKRVVKGFKDDIESIIYELNELYMMQDSIQNEIKQIKISEIQDFCKQGEVFNVYRDPKYWRWIKKENQIFFCGGVLGPELMSPDRICDVVIAWRIDENNHYIYAVYSKFIKYCIKKKYCITSDDWKIHGDEYKELNDFLNEVTFFRNARNYKFYEQFKFLQIAILKKLLQFYTLNNDFENDDKIKQNCIELDERMQKYTYTNQYGEFCYKYEIRRFAVRKVKGWFYEKVIIAKIQGLWLKITHNIGKIKKIALKRWLNIMFTILLLPPVLFAFI